MGKIKYQEEIKELFRKSPVVSYSSIEKIVKNKKNIKQYTKQLIRNLLLKKKIKRLAKGYYTIINDSSLAVYCFKPAYLGLQDSLSFHNLWEQETIPVIIVLKNQPLHETSNKIKKNNLKQTIINQQYKLENAKHLKDVPINLPEIEDNLARFLFDNEDD